MLKSLKYKSCYFRIRRLYYKMLKAYSWLTFCVIVWGSNFVFGKMLVQDFSPTLLTSLRLFFIVLLLVGLSSYKRHVKRLNKTEWLAIFALGIIGVFINQWSFFEIGRASCRERG